MHIQIDGRSYEVVRVGSDEVVVNLPESEIYGHRSRMPVRISELPESEREKLELYKAAEKLAEIKDVIARSIETGPEGVLEDIFTHIGDELAMSLEKKIRQVARILNALAHLLSIFSK